MASSTFLVLAPPHRASFLQGAERNPLLGIQAFSSRRSLGQTRTLQKKIDLHGPSPTSLRDKCLIVESTSGRNVKTAKDTIVPDPDYRIPVILLGSAAALIYTDNLLPAAPIGLLGLLLLFQTTRVKFLFDSEALEVKIGDQLQESGENVFVGGKNRWKYSTFVNWELWWPSFPVLVYFKETQTKPEGQVHFFPVIFNGKQLYDVMVERAGRSQNSAPK